MDKESEYLHQGKCTITDTHMKRCSIQFVFRRWKFKHEWNNTIYVLEWLKFFFFFNGQCQLLVRIRNFKNSHSLLVECKVLQILMRTAWQFLMKRNTILTHDREISLFSIYPKVWTDLQTTQQLHSFRYLPNWFENLYPHKSLPCEYL